MIRKSATVLVGIFICCLTVAAQNKKAGGLSLTDLQGTWVVDDDFISTYGNQTWTISVSGNVLKITKDLPFNNSRHEVTLLVENKWTEKKDSKGETTKSKISWKDGKLVREYSYKRSNSLNSGLLSPSYSTANVVETYYLSDKGARLVFRRDDDAIWPNRNTPTKMGRGFEDKVILRRKS